MPCPYAEKRGALVFCRATGKLVNPLAFPCLTDRYETCRFYKEAKAREAKEEKAKAKVPPSTEHPVASRAGEAERPSESVAARQQTLATRGLTADGRPARNCLECVFYSEATKTCLLLGVKVEDPNNPPCARS
jgi:hypothetical protein